MYSSFESSIGSMFGKDEHYGSFESCSQFEMVECLQNGASYLTSAEAILAISSLEADHSQVFSFEGDKEEAPAEHRNILQKIWDAIIKAIKFVVNGIANFLKGIWNFIKGLFGKGTDEDDKTLKDASDEDIKNVISTIFDKVGAKEDEESPITASIKKIAAARTEQAQKVIDSIRGAETRQEQLKKIISSIKAIQKKFDKVEDGDESIINNIKKNTDSMGALYAKSLGVIQAFQEVVKTKKEEPLNNDEAKLVAEVLKLSNVKNMTEINKQMAEAKKVLANTTFMQHELEEMAKVDKNAKIGGNNTNKEVAKIAQECAKYAAQDARLIQLGVNIEAEQLASRVKIRKDTANKVRKGKAAPVAP